MTQPRRVLILFAHPSLDRSEVNCELLRASQGREGVTVVDLYAEYPTFRIDVDREQQRLRDHDVIVFMFPLYWYSTPAILKEWQDLVLEYGFAYGQDGNELNGKWFLCALTAGGRADAYREQGLNHYTIRELMRPLEQTAVLCGMSFLPPYTLFGARSAMEEGRIGEHVAGWERALSLLVSGEVSTDGAGDFERLQQFLSLEEGVR
jgi:putative NADPH-quinone reductase